MTHWQISPVAPIEVDSLKKAHLLQLAAPMDGMWESFVGMGQHYAVDLQGQRIACFVVNAERKLLQFYAGDLVDSRSLFAQIVQEQNVGGAVVATGDCLFLSHCMDHQRSVAVNALVYHGTEKSGLVCPEDRPEVSFRVAVQSELGKFVDFACYSLNADRGWLEGYYSERISRQELWGLWQEGSILGAGECRTSDSQPPFADLGMVVSKDHRRRGLATEILQRLLAHAKAEGLAPICSTERDNIGAQRAIEKAGMVACHRILDISFV